jgi:hypothetical protein
MNVDCADAQCRHAHSSCYNATHHFPRPARGKMLREGQGRSDDATSDRKNISLTIARRKLLQETNIGINLG